MWRKSEHEKSSVKYPTAAQPPWAKNKIDDMCGIFFSGKLSPVVSLWPQLNHRGHRTTDTVLAVFPDEKEGVWLTCPIEDAREHQRAGDVPCLVSSHENEVLVKGLFR